MHNELRFVSAAQAQVPLESMMGRMEELEYQVEFLTPAFLGNAKQNGQWRTPPFKALLRQWWRVVWAQQNGYPDEVGEMRAEEAALFGTAADKGAIARNRKSLVRLRLDHWSKGKQNTKEMIDHGYDHGYLGFGPLSKAGQGDSKLQSEAAIRTKERAVLSLYAPASSVEQIMTAISLIDAYGTIGGRSRNGWGSIKLIPEGDTPPLSNNLSRFLRPWQEALGLDWAHAIGSDSKGPLIWLVHDFGDWQKPMQGLASTKKKLLHNFKPKGIQPHQKPQKRHWLSYPVTKQNVASWGNLRLPNSLRFKVRQDTRNSRKLGGIIFHMPCLPPEEFQPKTKELIEVWVEIHEYLDRVLKRSVRTEG